MGGSNSKQALGDDQFTEIFSHLPAKTAIKFSCLSKSLYSLFSNPSFVDKQTISSSLTHGGFFIQPNTLTYNIFELIQFHVFPGHRSLPSTFGIPKESLYFLHDHLIAVASSQGLVLILRQDAVFFDTADGNRIWIHKCVKKSPAREFYICNPATRRWASLSIPEWLRSRSNVDWRWVMFECHPRKVNFDQIAYDDYTIVIPTWVQREGSHPWCSSYNLVVYCNGRWEDIHKVDLKQHDKLCVDMPVGLFRGCDGGLVVHYLCESFEDVDGKVVCVGLYMIAYDIKRKAVSRTLKLPEGAWKAEKCCLKMIQWRPGETVGLVRMDEDDENQECLMTVWVLEDYARGSWRIVIEKTTTEMGVPEMERRSVFGCCVANGRGLVFATSTRVYVYEMVGNNAGRLDDVGEHRVMKPGMLQFLLYSNTLRPVCRVDEDNGENHIKPGYQTSKFIPLESRITFLERTNLFLSTVFSCFGNF